MRPSRPIHPPHRHPGLALLLRLQVRDPAPHQTPHPGRGLALPRRESLAALLGQLRLRTRAHQTLTDCGVHRLARQARQPLPRSDPPQNLPLRTGQHTNHHGYPFPNAAMNAADSASSVQPTGAASRRRPDAIRPGGGPHTFISTLFTSAFFSQ